MIHCEADPQVERVILGGLSFPLGVYPVEPMEPKPGYLIEFEPADGDSSPGDWEEWPDRYVFDAVVPTPRLPALCRMLYAMMPPRVYPILDVMGHDAFREIDPYISYELIGSDRFLDAIRRFHDFFYEDGLVGFGSMTDDPFFYFFIDEHKIVTIRVTPESKDHVEKLLKSFDLEPIEEPAGSDAAAHEHRTILLTPEDQPDLLGVDEIVERLREDWQLTLNIDPESNVDDAGKELGLTPWRCLVRGQYDSDPRWRYAEAFLVAPSLREAEELALDAALATESPAQAGELEDAVVVLSDRLTPQQHIEMLTKARTEAKAPTNKSSTSKPFTRWLT